MRKSSNGLVWPIFYLLSWSGLLFEAQINILSNFVFYDVIGNDVIGLFLADEIEEAQIFDSWFIFDDESDKIVEIQKFQVFKIHRKKV